MVLHDTTGVPPRPCVPCYVTRSRRRELPGQGVRRALLPRRGRCRVPESLAPLASVLASL